MKKVKFFIALSLLASVSCRKTPDLSVLDENFVVQTSKDPNAVFGSYKTYYISDTIRAITGDPKDSIWVGNDARMIVNAVKANMSNRGYQLVSRNSKPDLGISLVVAKELNVTVVYPGYWWGYYGGCYWGYCGYPPYYGYGSVYTLPTGTLIMDLIDLKNAVKQQKLVVIWSSVMSGALGTSVSDAQLGVTAVDQAFIQSDYLKAN